MHVRNTEIPFLHGEIVFPEMLWNPYHFLYEIYNNYLAHQTLNWLFAG